VGETPALASPPRGGPCVSLQRMTSGPLRGRPSLSLPARERTWFRRLAKHRPLRLSPESVRGRTRGGLRRRDAAISPSVDRSSLKGEHRSPAGLPSQSFKKAIIWESQTKRGPMILGLLGVALGSTPTYRRDTGKIRCTTHVGDTPSIGGIHNSKFALRNSQLPPTTAP